MLAEDSAMLADQRRTEADAVPADAPLAAVYDIPVQLTVVLGRSRMRISELLQLGRGAVIELDRKAAEPVDILINNRMVARGEVVLVEGRIGVTVTEILARA
jgi:flagellar motor switch protein FliN/FliY